MNDHDFTQIPIENIYTAAYLTQLYIKDDLFPRVKEERPNQFLTSEPSVYVIGEPSFRQKLSDNGVKVANLQDKVSQGVSVSDFDQIKLDPTVVGVIVGTDYNLSMLKICEAANYITKNGAELIGTNVDRTDGKDRLRPSGGSLIKIVQAAAGNPPLTVIGKPDTFCFNLLLQQHNLQDVPLDKFLMVGDNLSTDILFGNKCGIDSLLVLSGVTTAEKTEFMISEHNSSFLSDSNNVELEGVPTHVQSLLAQSEIIDFSKY